MHSLEEILENTYSRLSELRENDEYGKCLSCDCFFGLLYYMKKGLSKSEASRHQEMLSDVSSSFDNRSDIKMHQCLGCDPCPPAEWTSELLRGSNV